LPEQQSQSEAKKNEITVRYHECFNALSGTLGGDLPHKLNLGCGEAKEKGFVNLDWQKRFKPDVLWDISEFPWPFEDGWFETVFAFHILEHFGGEYIPIMQELHRIMQPGGVLYVRVPYYAYPTAWQDPTHKRAFSERSFHYFDPRYPEGEGEEYGNLFLVQSVRLQADSYEMQIAMRSLKE